LKNSGETGILSSKEDGPHHIIESKNDSADDHGEGIVLNGAGLNSPHHDRDPANQIGNPVHGAIDDEVVEPFPEACPQSLEGFDKENLIEFINIILVEDQSV
jgi:hypothetical protein